MAPLSNLEIRIRGTVQKDGSLQQAATVHCPVEQRSIELDACLECEGCERIGTDLRTGRAVVACRGHQLPARLPLGSEALAAQPQGPSAERVPIAELMTGDVICVAADLGIDALASLFLERGISGAPVVDDDGHPIGVISKTDLLREHHERPAGAGGLTEAGRAGGRRTARDVMTPISFALREHVSLAQAAALMVFEGIHRLPVVSQQNTVVGILSSLDVMRWLAENHGYLLSQRWPSGAGPVR